MLAGLGITTGFWFAPKLHAAISQATYVEQFCLVLSANSSSGCVQVSKPGASRPSTLPQGLTTCMTALRSGLKAAAVSEKL